MRIKYEVSAGGLLLRPRDSTYDALLIGRGTPPRIWTLPKGHVEARESNEQAALREVREETGCWGEIVTRLNEISYWFYVGKAKHRKAVTFYLMRYLSGDPANHDHEVDEARWFDMLQARKTLKVRQREAPGRSWRWSSSGRQSRRVRRSPGRRPDGRTENVLNAARRATNGDVAIDQASCRVQLDVFDGPLDLLLSLIKEQQLDIATVPLATVAEQYLAYVRAMKELDVEVAAEYLVIAATLVFLKSRALLPPIPHEFAGDEAETPEQVEERLRRRLIAYSKYRELGERLRASRSRQRAISTANPAIRAARSSSDTTSIPRNSSTRSSRCSSQARPEKRSIARERVSLIASMDYIVRRIKESGEVTFSELCHELGMTREVVIVTFLAMLELIRRHRVAFEQPELFDDIRIFPVGAGDRNGRAA